MDIFSLQFLSALAAIVVIDLVLAGDNAIVIGLAARKLPPEMQKKAVMWGAVGAVVVRAVLTLAVVWLLKIPGFLLMGGITLIWIAYHLMEEDNDAHDNIAPAASFRQAIKTIVIADAVMGVDNVLAVAGAAHGSFLLVVIGLLISIPIVMLGSTLVLKWIERYPFIIVIGAAVLGWTAAKMIT
ncbi:MAG: TerC family protein, partial [Betaproteobacteria bacterium]|nr:TerC family protein [Betaproteobacteria bacterium]